MRHCGYLPHMQRQLLSRISSNHQILVVSYTVLLILPHLSSHQEQLRKAHRSSFLYSVQATVLLRDIHATP